MADGASTEAEIESKLQRANWAQQVKETVIKKMQALVDKDPEKCAKAIRTLIFDAGDR